MQKASFNQGNIFVWNGERHQHPQIRDRGATKMNRWKLSRYWNRFAYFVMHLGKSMIWDQTGRNEDILKHAIDPYCEEMLTGREPK